MAHDPGGGVAEVLVADGHAEESAGHGLQPYGPLHVAVVLGHQLQTVGTGAGKRTGTLTRDDSRVVTAVEELLRTSTGWTSPVRLFRHDKLPYEPYELPVTW
ncbi:hypothetical protein ACGFZ9_41310 [Streptomyces mirabilis]|uniref:hypothetical protein n=1 Tax=Streptomyces mirabilis TaxID=68239 RepID=UPI0037113C13